MFLQLENLSLEANNLKALDYKNVINTLPSLKYLNIKHNRFSPNYKNEINDYFKFHKDLKVDIYWGFFCCWILLSGKLLVNKLNRKIGGRFLLTRRLSKLSKFSFSNYQSFPTEIKKSFKAYQKKARQKSSPESLSIPINIQSRFSCSIHSCLS
jgi:hypothetical protein